MVTGARSFPHLRDRRCSVRCAEAEGAKVRWGIPYLLDRRYGRGTIEAKLSKGAEFRRSDLDARRSESAEAEGGAIEAEEDAYAGELSLLRCRRSC